MTIYYKNGFYDDTDGGFVPEGAVEITENLYRQLLEGQNNGKQIYPDKNGKPILRDAQPSSYHEWDEKAQIWQLTAEKHAELLAIIRSTLIDNIASKLDVLQQATLVGYSQTEKGSFSIQEKEALAWKEDNTTPCPMLTQIAENRGVPFEILAEKVLEKAALFAVGQGMLIGQKQAFEDRAERATTLEEINQIAEEVSLWQLPGAYR